jgi:hypothetical protein
MVAVERQREAPVDRRYEDAKTVVGHGRRIDRVEISHRPGMIVERTIDGVREATALLTLSVTKVAWSRTTVASGSVSVTRSGSADIASMAAPMQHSPLAVSPSHSLIKPRGDAS